MMDIGTLLSVSPVIFLFNVSFPNTLFSFFMVAIFFAGSGTAFAEKLEATTIASPALAKVDVVERRGENIDLDLQFVSHTGELVTLREYFKGDKPVLLTLNYYNCASLCSAQLNAMLDTLKKMKWTAGDQFRIVTISFDPTDTPEIAAQKRTNYINELGKGEVDWTFLVGQPPQIKAITESVGFGYAYDAIAKQYAHAAVLMFLSPDGMISQYIYGIEYFPQDIKFSLMQAGEGKIGNILDKLIMSCFAYDYDLGKFTPTAFGIMRIGGLITLMALSLFAFLLWKRELQTRGRAGSKA